jgi:hypothetical protein
LKFEKSTEILDNILSHQISPFIKTGLGYDNNQKTLEENASSKSPEKKIEEKPESYANILKISNHSGDNHKERNHDQQETDFSFKKDKDEFRRGAPSRRPFTTRYQNIFLGYCFSCKNFGHKEIDCRVYGRNNYVRNRSRRPHNHEDDHMNNQTRSFHGTIDRNYNPFSPLHYKVECYKCNNYGHIARDCRSNMTKPSRPGYKKVWKRKQEKENKEECELAWYAQNKEHNVHHQTKERYYKSLEEETTTRRKYIHAGADCTPSTK